MKEDVLIDDADRCNEILKTTFDSVMVTIFSWSFLQGECSSYIFILFSQKLTCSLTLSYLSWLPGQLVSPGCQDSRRKATVDHLIWTWNLV